MSPQEMDELLARAVELATDFEAEGPGRERREMYRAAALDLVVALAHQHDARLSRARG